MTETSDSTSAATPNNGPGPAPARLADLVAAAPSLGFSDAFPRAARIRAGVLALLFLAVYWRLLEPMLRICTTESNWYHGLVIPLFSLYLLYIRRDELYAARRRTCIWGLPLALACILGGLYVILHRMPGAYWAAQMAMVGAIFGLVLYLAGPRVIRLTWLPILFLAFAVPIPELLYQRISLPLQNLSAKGAVMMLRAGGVEIVSTASMMTLISRAKFEHPLEVAEACSGMRILMAFMALSVAMAYLDYKPLWQRVILVAAGIPIAIFCNVLRVTITCMMYYYDRPELGQDFMHYFTGMLMLVPAFLLLWALAWVLKHLVREEPDAQSAAEAAP